MPETNENFENASSDSTSTALKTFKFTVAGLPDPQWTLEVKETTPGSNEFDFEVFNLDPESGIKKFFGLANKGDHGQPIIYPEPSLGMPLDKLGFDFKLTGCILINPDGTIADRFSLSRKTVIQKIKVSFNQDDLELYLDGQPSGWFLNLLLLKDKNRIKGSDGYFGRTKPEKVEVRELENLANSILKEMGLL